MLRFVSAVPAIALIAGFAAAAHAQSAYSDTTGETSSSTTTTNVAQAPVRTVASTDAGFAVRPGPYLRLNTGYSWANSHGVDEFWIIGAGAGWRFSPNLRGDITFDYRPDFDQTTSFGIGPGAKRGLHNWTLMANGYYDFTIDAIQPLVPYVGAGFGIAQNSLHGATVTVPGTGIATLTGHDSNQFAWQLSAGVSYNFTPNAALDVGYRYLDAGETGLGGKLHSNELTTSLRFGF